MCYFSFLADWLLITYFGFSTLEKQKEYLIGCLSLASLGHKKKKWELSQKFDFKPTSTRGLELDSGKLSHKSQLAVILWLFCMVTSPLTSW